MAQRAQCFGSRDHMAMLCVSTRTSATAPLGSWISLRGREICNKVCKKYGPQNLANSTFRSLAARDLNMTCPYWVHMHASSISAQEPHTPSEPSTSDCSSTQAEVESSNKTHN